MYRSDLKFKKSFILKNGHSFSKFRVSQSCSPTSLPWLRSMLIFCVGFSRRFSENSKNILHVVSALKFSEILPNRAQHVQSEIAEIIHFQNEQFVRLLTPGSRGLLRAREGAAHPLEGVRADEVQLQVLSSCFRRGGWSCAAPRCSRCREASLSSVRRRMNY